MNPPLLQPLYDVTYSVNANNKFSEEEAFGSGQGFTQNDFSYLPRRSQSELNNASLGPTFSVPGHSGLEYNPTSNIQGSTYLSGAHAFFNQQTNINTAHTGSIASTVSPFTLIGTSKPAVSNAVSTEQFPISISSFPDSAWNMPTMTEMQNTRHTAIHPNPSSSGTYGHVDGISSHYHQTESNRPIDPFSGTYGYRLPLAPPNLPHGTFDRQGRVPGFNHLPSPYPMSSHYTPMAPQQPVRPEGPPFEDTKVIQPLVTSTRQSIQPEISASIQKGFFQVDGKWTCYRRNYFTVACAFTFRNGLPEHTVYLQRNAQSLPVQQYGISISAKTANQSNQESEVRTLVQHTPKRDKATESTPGRHIVQPATSQAFHSTGLSSTNALFYPNHHTSSSILSPFDAFSASNHSSIPSSYTFERIQFQKATANNGKRRAQQQFFQVVVELSVNVGTPAGVNTPAKDDWVLVATKQSHPMVVRGRSPGHYKDNIRRDSQTNMDPDRGTGGGGDGGLINQPMSYHHSTTDWAPHRSQNQFSSTYSGRAMRLDASPQSLESSPPLTSSPAEAHFQLPSISLDRHSFRPGSDVRISRSNLANDGLFGADNDYYGFTKRQTYDNDGSDMDCDIYTEAVSSKDGVSQRMFELPTTSNLKALCSS